MHTITDASLNKLAEQVAEILGKNNHKLVTAESCTGGWVAKCCTDLSGSSAWYDRGYVTYSNEAKHDSLNVSHQTLDQHGAVSQAVAEQMALGAITHSQATISVAITGIAGPNGGSEAKPVGTVWIAWAHKKHVLMCHCFSFNGDRESIRRQAVYQALVGIIENARDSLLSMG